MLKSHSQLLSLQLTPVAAAAWAAGEAAVAEAFKKGGQTAWLTPFTPSFLPQPDLQRTRSLASQLVGPDNLHNADPDLAPTSEGQGCL